MNKNKILGFAVLGAFGFAFLLYLIYFLVEGMRGFFEAFKYFGDTFERILAMVLFIVLAIGVLVLSIFGILKALKDDNSKLVNFTTLILLAYAGVSLLSRFLIKINAARNGGQFSFAGKEIVGLLFEVFMLAGALVALLLKGEDKAMARAIAGIVAAASLLVLVVLSLADGGNGLLIVFNVFLLLAAVSAAAVYALPLLSKE